MDALRLSLPLSKFDVLSLTAGDRVLLSGVLYTARDAAHQRMAELLDQNLSLPVDLNGALLYYTGPSPARPGDVIGSAGPTTSSRMDLWTPRLIAQCGLRGTIGKGNRARAVVDAMAEHGAVYFAALGGAGALLASCVTGCEVAAYPDLGAEAIHRLEVRDFPVTVAIDCRRGNLYHIGPETYLKARDGR